MALLNGFAPTWAGNSQGECEEAVTSLAHRVSPQEIVNSLTQASGRYGKLYR
jgi:hypothetical protein